jgi:hypothetical protein
MDLKEGSCGLFEDNIQAWRLRKATKLSVKIVINFARI